MAKHGPPLSALDEDGRLALRSVEHYLDLDGVGAFMLKIDGAGR